MFLTYEKANLKLSDPKQGKAGFKRERKVKTGIRTFQIAWPYLRGLLI